MLRSLPISRLHRRDFSAKMSLQVSTASLMMGAIATVSLSATSPLSMRISCISIAKTTTVVAKPSTFVTFVEDKTNDDGNFATASWNYSTNAFNDDTSTNVVGRFHPNNSTNLVFTDGHVENCNKPEDEIRKLCAQYK